MNLGYIILAHNQPDAVRRVTSILASGGDRVVIHFDRKAAPADMEKVRQLEKEHPENVRVISHVHCVWGEWSLVEAVLVSLREFATMSDPPDYIHLMSGADFPIRPIADLKEFLRRHPNQDFIECCDITQRQWVKGGLGRERFRFFYPFNFRTSRRAFDRMVRWQRKLKIRRPMPLQLTPHMGSQWWTLRWSTCAKLLDFVKQNPRVIRFFRSTWIPDESFFQTLIAKIIPTSEIADLQLIFHHLGPTGRPYVFYNDHLPLLRKLPHFFIRKVSPDAADVFSILEKPRPQRPIPQPKHLARARDLIRHAIDGNHRFVGQVPGYCDPPEIPPPAAERPMIIFLATDPEQLPTLEKLTRDHPACLWLGRPFAPGRLAMPEDTLALTGMSATSWKLRDHFPHEFIDLLTHEPPKGCIPAIPATAILMNEDIGFAHALGRHPNMLPIMIEGPLLTPHLVSRFNGLLHDASPALHARVIRMPMQDVGRMLEALVRSKMIDQGTQPNTMIPADHRSSLTLQASPAIHATL